MVLRCFFHDTFIAPFRDALWNCANFWTFEFNLNFQFVCCILVIQGTMGGWFVRFKKNEQNKKIPEYKEIWMLRIVHRHLESSAECNQANGLFRLPQMLDFCKFSPNYIIRCDVGKLETPHQFRIASWCGCPVSQRQGKTISIRRFPPASAAFVSFVFFCRPDLYCAIALLSCTNRHFWCCL